MASKAKSVHLSAFYMNYPHEIYMQRCLQLAIKAAGNVAPNPMVGAVLVAAGRIIGEGYHGYCGGPHAEVNCMNSVRPEDAAFIKEATLYVSLEPCVHFGKTPPCADLIIKNEIPRVVIGCADPFEAVNGKGIDKLKAAGIHVVENVLQQECRQLNKRFFCFHTQKRPYIVLKWAQTANGFIGAPGKRVYISNEICNRLVHQWRTEEAAILIGKNTLLNDDPLLTARLWPGNNPVRIIVDKELRLGTGFKLFEQPGRVVVLNCIKDEETGNVYYKKIDAGVTLAKSVLQALYELKLQSVFVEGGAATHQSFINEALWDEVRVITSDGTIDAGVTAPVLYNACKESETEINNNLITFYNKIAG
jgi:diaminohydroxyphosphoribosylaminopyrimidine deaminase/5-amino-6-(5-phosphoribosylamino)uracil reductase